MKNEGTADGGKRKIPFSPPDVGEREIEAVAETLRSGWITTGPRTKLLERRVADYIGVGTTEKGTPRCVCLNSQTACAEMALHALGIGALSGGSAADEVIVPAYTYTASASVVCHVGAKLVLVDVSPDGLQFDYDALKRAVTENTKAIIPVDLGGVPCDYDRIFEIVGQKKALFKPSSGLQRALGRVAVLADAAHAFGAVRKGVMVGNIADFSAFSWHAVKNFTTGEGGCLTWRPIEGVDEDGLYRLFQLLSLHGQSKDALSKDKPGMWEYDIVEPWYKCNMTDIMASIGLAQLDRYPAMLARRREIITRYDGAFRPLGVGTLPHYTDRYSSSGHLYITRVFHRDGSPVSDGERREIIVEMAEEGVACNVHYKPLPLLTAYKKRGFDPKDFPNALAHYENEITLPLHTRLSDEDVDYVIGSYEKILKKHI
ncbi:MAG: DegT/DnrJ/EryC1/StrS aminotransferase family protein [Clostridia bacterium]|nr:DegT/DnrJ/EryC1/StrS aminotransferase family protein [Clostridia bacterium]